MFIESKFLFPETRSLFERIKAHTTISFTAFALAPGVLKTTTPFFEQFSISILLVPAPALAIAKRLFEISSSVKLWLLSTIPLTSA